MRTFWPGPVTKTQLLFNKKMHEVPFSSVMLKLKSDLRFRPESIGGVHNHFCGMSSQGECSSTRAWVCACACACKCACKCVSMNRGKKNRIEKQLLIILSKSRSTWVTDYFRVCVCVCVNEYQEWINSKMRHSTIISQWCCLNVLGAWIHEKKLL